MLRKSKLYLGRIKDGNPEWMAVDHSVLRWWNHWN